MLALLPFEPEAYRRLRGPPCSYVGHPLIEQLGSLRPGRRRAGAPGRGTPPVLLVLPGSRRSEIRHHMAIFGEALGRLQARGHGVRVDPADHAASAGTRSREGVKTWPVAPRIVVGEQEKRAAFRIARAALAKSGTVTLELALAGVPMVAAYRAGAIEAWIVRRAITVQSVILANLVIGENVVPEFIQDDCTADNLAGALARSARPIRRCASGSSRPLRESTTIMSTGNQSPSVRAADIVLATLRKSRRAELGRFERAHRIDRSRKPLRGIRLRDRRLISACRYRRSRGG